MDLLNAVGEGLISEQFIEYFQIENITFEPIHP